MSDDIETPSAKPSRAVTAWTLGLLCLSIVAGGVIVSGLLHHPEHELTTAPVTTTKPKPEKEHTYVTPAVTYPTQIPGCATVEPPGKGEGFSMASAGRDSYDNPAYPWFSGPKAVAMSAAALDALPDGVALGFAPLDDSLVFQPMFSPFDPADAARFRGYTTAHATLTRDGKAGSLSVSVEQSTEPIPACVAGDLDARRVLPDGTTVDTHDTWLETDGVRMLARSATAYTPDGSRVSVSAEDSSDTGSPSGKVPMTIDELVALATVPGVRVTAPVPPGTPDAPPPCRYWPTPKKASTPIDETTARRLDTVLSRIPLDGLILDRPLGALRPESDGPGVCQAVRVTTPGQQSELRIAITVERTRPTESAQPSRSDPRTSTRTLPDGTVIATREPDGSGVAAEANSPQVTRTIVVTRPSGTEVEVSSTAKSVPELLSAARLEAIASTPDLEVK